MNDEEKPSIATILSLASGALFLYVALLLRIQQPFSFIMVISILTIFVAMFMYAYPQHHMLCGVIIIVSSVISFLTIEMGAPWSHVIIWH